MTQDPRTRWALNCTVKFECLLGYQLEGEKEFICKNGTWEPDEDIPSCKYRIRSYSFLQNIAFNNLNYCMSTNIIQFE